MAYIKSFIELNIKFENKTQNAGQTWTAIKKTMIFHAPEKSTNHVKWMEGFNLISQICWETPTGFYVPAQRSTIPDTYMILTPANQ